MATLLCSNQANDKALSEMGKVLHSKEGSMATSNDDMNNNAARLITVRESDMPYDPYIFRKIYSEMNRTRDALEQIQKNTNDNIKQLKKTRSILNKIQENTKDSIKEMKWYKRRRDNVPVYIRMSFVMVGHIDAIKQEFQCEFYMAVRWNEPELIGKTTDDIIDWENYWDPSICIVDIVSYEIYEKTQKLIPSEDANVTPDVFQYFHIKGTFKEVTVIP